MFSISWINHLLDKLKNFSTSFTNYRNLFEKLIEIFLQENYRKQMQKKGDEDEEDHLTQTNIPTTRDDLS